MMALALASAAFVAAPAGAAQLLEISGKAAVSQEVWRNGTFEPIISRSGLEAIFLIYYDHSI